MYSESTTIREPTSALVLVTTDAIAKALTALNDVVLFNDAQFFAVLSHSISKGWSKFCTANGTVIPTHNVSFR